jgi:7-carboxy-7-deazaguanine synthase
MEKEIGISEFYTCIQGEGKYTGVPHILVRMVGCPMRCVFGSSICDSWYTSWAPEPFRVVESTLVNFYKKNSHIKHTMITGGEPTSNPTLLNRLVNIAKDFGHFVTIETAGIAFVKTKADFISLSPKLSSTTPKAGGLYKAGDKVIKVPQAWVTRHKSLRNNYDIMLQLISYYDYQFKPVVSNFEKDIEEIEEMVKRLKIPNCKIYLMPAGATREELDKIRVPLIEYCIKKGYNYTDRIHIVAYDNKRGV